MKTKKLIHRALITLLFGTPLFGMDLSSDEETQLETERTVDEQSNSNWGIGSFITSQVAGARELLAYGSHATGDLVSRTFPVQHNDQTAGADQLSAYGSHAAGDPVSRMRPARQHDPTVELISGNGSEQPLVALFLRDFNAFKQLASLLSKDVSKYIVRYLLQGHPLVTFLRSKLAEPLCLATLQGHTELLTAAELNRTGDRIVTASRDKTAKIWDVATGHCLLTVEGHGKYLNSAEFNRIGDRIVTTADDNTAKIWDATTGHCLHTLQGHLTGPYDTVFSAQFNGAGDRIVTASLDCTAKIWDAATGQCLHTLNGHAKRLNSAEFNQAGDRIVTASNDKTAKIWDAFTGTCLYTLQGHGTLVSSAHFNAAGDRIVTAAEDSTVRIWDAATGNCVHTLKGPAFESFSVRFSKFHPA